VGREIALGGAHLVDPPGHELPLAHKGVWGQAGGMAVVGGGRGVGGPVLEQPVHCPGSQGVVGVCYELGRRDVASRGEGGVENKGETS